MCMFPTCRYIQYMYMYMVHVVTQTQNGPERKQSLHSIIFPFFSHDGRHSACIRPQTLKMPIQYRTCTSLTINQVSYRKKQKITKCLIAFPSGFQYNHPPTCTLHVAMHVSGFEKRGHFALECVCQLQPKITKLEGVY